MFELTWLLGLLIELDIKVDVPVDVFSESKSALQIAANPVVHERTKYIKIGHHFIKEKIQQAKVKARYISTRDQPVDLLTKGLSKAQHQYLNSKSGVLNIFRAPNLRESVDRRNVT